MNRHTDPDLSALQAFIDEVKKNGLSLEKFDEFKAHVESAQKIIKPIATKLSASGPRHPAKFSVELLPLLAALVAGEELVLDPFAGTGRVHLLGPPSIGVEIEPEWARMHPRTIVGDALHLPFRDGSIACVCTSCTYGNRMADHHDAKDDSRRNTYRHALGRELHPNNSGQLQWGMEYRKFHIKAWREVHRVLKPGGKFILNISDHIRKGEFQGVVAWHKATIELGGLFERVAAYPVPTKRNRQGANGNARVTEEWVLVYRKVA